MPNSDELIRKALADRAATVTEDTLRYRELPQYPPTARTRRTRRPGCAGRARMFFATAATIAAVVAITVGINVVGNRSHHPDRPASQTPLASTGWRLTEVRSGTVTWRVPSAYLVGLAFGADGWFHGRDIIQAFTGRYATSGGRITVYGVTPRLRQRLEPQGASSPAERALTSILVPTSPHAHAVTSTFSLTSTTLTVTGSRWTLSFRPLGAAAGDCLDTPSLRAGTDTAMVPPTPTSVTICPFGPTQTPQAVTDIAELVHALDALPTSPVSNRCRVHGPHSLVEQAPTGGGVPPAGEYELHFHYQAGPDVLINLYSPCASRPRINNQRLEALALPREIDPLIRAALAD